MRINYKIELFYFILTFITTIILVTYSEFIKPIWQAVWLIPFLIFGLSFIRNLLKKDTYMILWLQRTKKINFYFLILSIVMVITNIYSQNIGYSIIASMFSVLLLAIMFNVIGPLIIMINDDLKGKKIISIQLVLILTIAMIGNLIIPNWNWYNSLQLSGGLSPNMMALVSLFCCIWFLDLKIDKLFPQLTSAGLILSITALFWTMSRGRIGGFILLILFLIFMFIIILLNKKLNYRLNKKVALKNSVLVVIVILLLPFGIYFLINQPDVLSRLQAPNETRYNAWIILINGFKENVFFGSLGWWNANSTIQTYSNSNLPIANSAHNLYLRLLSEVGILGLISIMFLPLWLFINSLKAALLNGEINKQTRKKLLLYSGAILAFFFTQFVEDQYMNGIGDFQTGLFMWILTLTYYYISNLNKKHH